MKGTLLLCLLLFSTLTAFCQEFIGNEFRLFDPADYQLVRSDMEGSVVWIHEINNSSYIDTTEGFYMIYGETSVHGGRITSNPADYDYWVVKREELEAELFPNPAVDWVNIFVSFTENTYIQVWDSSNRVVIYLPLLDYNSSLNVSNLSPGIYFYSILKSNEKIKTGKICVQRLH